MRFSQRYKKIFLFMKLSHTTQTIVTSVMTTVLVAASLFAIATVFAAPTQAPPTGNPSFPLTGPVGPIGPVGPQGASGATATLNCVQNSTYFSGTSVSVSCPGSGYTATGGGFYLSDGNNNGLNWNDGWSRPSGSTAWECGRNVYSGNSSYCYITCCKLQ